MDLEVIGQLLLGERKKAHFIYFLLFSLAGSMLAHLHTLQSDNRQMQSRIMELASQREFYIAINTKLRQTLTEHELGK